MNDEKPKQFFFCARHWFFILIVVLFWVKTPVWFSGDHIGYELLVLYVAMFFFFLSPIFAIADLFITQTYYEDKVITKFGFWIRRIWSGLLLLNVVVFLWCAGAFDSLLS
jgi:hypothetical protein